MSPQKTLAREVLIRGSILEYRSTCLRLSIRVRATELLSDRLRETGAEDSKALQVNYGGTGEQCDLMLSCDRKAI